MTLHDQDTEQTSSPSSGSSAQIIIDAVVGQMVMSADGLAPYADTFVRDAITGQDTGASAERLAGALLERLGSDQRFSVSLSVSTQPSYATAWTVWVSHSGPERWSVASGPDPDHLTGLNLPPGDSSAPSGA